MTRIGLGTAGAAALAWGWFTLFAPGPVGTSLAKTLAPVCAATGTAPAAHLTMNLRSREGEDFSYVDLGGEMTSLEAWVLWPSPGGDPGKVRVEKKDLAYSFDGSATTYYRPATREVYRHEGGSAKLEEFWPAAWLRSLIDHPAGLEVARQSEAEGLGRLLLRGKGAPVEGRAPVFFGEFDREVEVEWDLATRRLTGFRRWVLSGGRRVLFSELVSINYPVALSSAVFELEIPADARRGGVTGTSVRLDRLGPKEAAAAFWTAAMERDPAALEALCPVPSVREDLRIRPPAELISLGEPLRTGTYAGVYVPYRIRFGDGAIREGRLALRNDNEIGRWVFDGGY